MILPLDPATLAYGLAMAEQPQIRPDGSEVVYSLVTVDLSTRQGRSRLWRCGIDEGAARPLTGVSEPATWPRWSPDGSRIAYVSGEATGARIMEIDPDGGALARCVARHAQAIVEPDWAPDGRRIAYTTLFDPENPHEQPEPNGAPPRVRVTRRLDHKEDGRGYLGDRRRQVFVVDVSAGSTQRLTGEPVDHQGPRWSPDGQEIAVCRHGRPGAGSQLVLLDVHQGSSVAVGAAASGMVSWSWSPTGEHIFFAADPDRTLQPDYFLYRRSDGTIRRLTTDLRSMPEPTAPVWLDEDHVLVASMRGGASRLEIVEIGSGAVEVLHTFAARNRGLSLDRAGRYIAQAKATPTSIGEICIQDRERGTGKTVTRHNDSLLAARPPADWEAFQVCRDGLTIDAWLLKPPGFDPTVRHPLVLDVHGGPSASYGYGFLAHQQCLATNGFLVLYANPRGSTSCGRQFAQQVVLDWGGGDYEDLLAVLDAVLERPYVDPARTGIFGISYGGYLTSWAIGHTDRFAAAVCGAPIFDLESYYGTSDVGSVGLDYHAGGPPHLRADWYRAHSPSTFAHLTRTPTLIFHGEADLRCPIGQSEQMFVALHQAGCEVELLRYPEGSHMFFASGHPAHRADFLARTLAWFTDHLGGPPLRARDQPAP